MFLSVVYDFSYVVLKKTKNIDKLFEIKQLIS